MPDLSIQQKGGWKMPERKMPTWKQAAAESILDESSGFSSGRVAMFLSLSFFLFFGVVGVVFAIFKNSVGTTFCLGMATAAMGKGVADVFATQKKSAQVLSAQAASIAARPPMTPQAFSPSSSPISPPSPSFSGSPLPPDAPQVSPQAAFLEQSVRAVQMATLLASNPSSQPTSEERPNKPTFLLTPPSNKERFFLTKNTDILLDLSLMPKDKR